MFSFQPYFFLLQFLVIKTLNPDPDSLEMKTGKKIFKKLNRLT